MKQYTFRVTQPLVGYYEGELKIQANSKEEAKKLLVEMDNSELEELCQNWNQVSENMGADGDIEIQSLISEEYIQESEEFQLDYKDLSELSYYDTKQELIDLYKKDLLVGYVEVWTDRENSNREYIVINNEIVYLDTITKLNNENI